jgi:hypothetical protein
MSPDRPFRLTLPIREHVDGESSVVRVRRGCCDYSLGNEFVPAIGAYGSRAAPSDDQGNQATSRSRVPEARIT